MAPVMLDVVNMITLGCLQQYDHFIKLCKEYTRKVFNSVDVQFTPRLTDFDILFSFCEYNANPNPNFGT